MTGKIITSREPIDLLRFLGPVGKPWLKRVDYLARIRTPRLPPHDQNLEAANVGTLRKKDVFVSRIKDLPPPTEAEEYRNTAEILHDLVAQVRFDNTRDALVSFAWNLDLLAAYAEDQISRATDWSPPPAASQTQALNSDGS